MQAVAVKASGTDRPPLVHACPGTKARRLLLGAENAAPADRRQTRDRATVSSDDVFRPGLDVANAACERLVRFTKTDRLAHSRHNLVENDCYVAHSCATINRDRKSALFLLPCFHPDSRFSPPAGRDSKPCSCEPEDRPRYLILIVLLALR